MDACGAGVRHGVSPWSLPMPMMPTISAIRSSPDTARSKLWSVVMIAAGVAALALPLATGTAITLLFAWLILFTGVLHMLHSLTTRRLGAFTWHALIGLLYGGAGLYMIMNPELSLNTLTLVLALLFALEGGLRIGGYFYLRRLAASSWLLADGLLTLALGVLIAATWPQSSVWAIGVLIGVNLILSGVSRLVQAHALGQRA
jgi:uncharacterized membrane protein HdeD (DUF308 family)